MKLDEAVKTIYLRWMALWPGLSTNIPYVFDNDAQPETAPSFARVSVQTLPTRKWTMGQTSKYRRDGLINVKLSGPSNAGRKTVDVLAGYVITIFEGKRFGTSAGEEGIVCRTSSPTEIGSDGQFWTLLVATEFDYYETH